MKTRRLGLILTTLFLTLLTPLAPAAAEDAKPTAEEGPVATVNGVSITRHAFDREMSLMERRIRRPILNLPADQIAQLRDSILNDLINRELLFQESVAKKIEIPEAETQKEFDRIKGRYKDPKKFETIMSQMQMTEASLKEQIQRKAVIQKLIDQEVGDKITMTEDEAKLVYEEHTDDFKQQAQVRARHILIKVAPDADEAAKAEARKKLEAVVEKVKTGEDFAELAKTHSEGPSNVRGGDLGFFGQGQMVKPFEEAAFSLEPGKVSDIVETRFGYHLIKVEEKKAERALSFDEVKGKLMEKLKRGKIEREMMTYILSLREKAKIETLLPGTSALAPAEAPAKAAEEPKKKETQQE